MNEDKLKEGIIDYNLDYDVIPKEKEVKKLYKLKICTLFLTGFNTLLIFFGPLPTRDYYNSEGTKLRTDSSEFIYSLLLVLGIALPICAMLISLLVAIVPYQNKAYSNKILWIFLILFLIGNIVFSILLFQKIFIL